jgi:hypothetical protein
LVESTTITYRSSIFILEERLSKYLTKKAETTSPLTTITTIELKKKHMYVEIPYVGQTTNSIRSKFKHLSSKLSADLQIRYFTKPPPPPSIHFFFQNKVPIVEYMSSNIVYSVNCKDCEQI